MKKKDVIYYFVLTILSFMLFYVCTDVLVFGFGSGVSMAPKMANSDFEIGYKFESNYSVGDVVIAKPKMWKEWMDCESVTKRIAGIPGDKIIINGKSVYVNDVLIDNEFVNNGKRKVEYILGREEYFLIGDNRANSLDSRILGPVHVSDLIAKVIFWINL